MRTHTTRQSGFTLLEMGIVLLILSIMAGGVLNALTQQARIAKQAELNMKLDAIEKALLSFRKNNNRLPCPANIASTNTSSVFGQERTSSGWCTGTFIADNQCPTSGHNCTIADGVPVRALGLPDDYAFDPWGDRIMYVMDKRAGLNPNPGGDVFNDKLSTGAIYPLNPITGGTAGLGSIMVRGGDTSGANANHILAAPPIATTNRAGTTMPLFSTPTCNNRTLTLASVHNLQMGDMITINNVGGYFYNGTVPVETTPTATTLTYCSVGLGAPENTADTGGWVSGPAPAVALLISFGPNGHGAYQYNSSARKYVGSTNAQELKNCHCTATAVGTFDNLFYMQSSTVTSGDVLSTFDDTVRFYTRAQLSSGSEMQTEIAY